LLGEMVSIPLWDDWKAIALSLALSSTTVSIPLWDDWKPSVEFGWSLGAEFQFHYGMIGRQEHPC